MNLANKFIIGLALSDPDYGINTKGKFKQVFNLATENGYRFFDTAANYKNSHLYSLYHHCLYQKYLMYSYLQ